MMPPKVRAWFAVVGFAGDPSEVSRTLGLDPEQAWRAGEGIGGVRTPQPEAGWRIRSPLGADADVEEHASALLGRLPQRLPASLAAPGVYAQFSFAVELGGEMPAISFSPETLRRMAMLDAGIDIDVRVVG